jgi:hypothetical protein
MPATREYLQGLYDDALCYLCDINSQVELRQNFQCAFDMGQVALKPCQRPLCLDNKSGEFGPFCRKGRNYIRRHRRTLLCR